MPDEVGHQYGRPDGGSDALSRAGMLAPDKDNRGQAQDEKPQGNGKAAGTQTLERYLIVTVNPNYTGQAFGVQINRGIGILDATSVNHKLGWTMADIVVGLRDMGGYTITSLEGKDVVSAIQAVRKMQDDQEAAAINTIRALAGLGADRVMELIAAARQG